ncbi:gamma-butyrobetaine dioxygenase [Magnaporthiopsis poae ATCC 64411]|uniref:Gamma-butyrobetaine dioxygenase n=1 Tax=Magnaporthiopsis poae (strain ATCC 64411 / 73-15) TaxID=644358 RepID=A0A0C4DVL5_MAGP6|nr:gamma-butyrobetaine dioxygenase [Magnaporthiopsis poae ATCC 64411]
MSQSGFRIGARLSARATLPPIPVRRVPRHCLVPKGAQGCSHLAGGAQRRPGSGSAATGGRHARPPPLSVSSGVTGQRSASNHRPQQHDDDRWALSVRLASGEEARLSKLWLRDSCRDAACAPEAMFEYKMEPGECVIFDNMRVLHGRRQFNVTSGKRWLKGTYVQEQVMLSKLAQMPAALRSER